jgi:hypothetical protein
MCVSSASSCGDWWSNILVIDVNVNVLCRLDVFNVF